MSDTDTTRYGRTRRKSRRHAKYIITNSGGNGRVYYIVINVNVCVYMCVCVCICVLVCGGMCRRVCVWCGGVCRSVFVGYVMVKKKKISFYK